MKLTGSASDIAGYHTQEENYYFSQSDGVSELLREAGFEAKDETTYGHVSVSGGLARELGFEPGERISEQSFQNLLEGKNAMGEQATANTHRVHGIDLTLSAPKSVSVAGLLTDRDPGILRAHEQAVEATMREIEKHYAYAQPRAGHDVKSEGMAWVSVKDGFNRDHEPHLHTHNILMNMTKHDDKIMALRMSKIMSPDFNKMWGAHYRMGLAHELERQGYHLSYQKDGGFRMDNVSLATEREFSQRHEEIIEARKSMSDAQAWRNTREAKNPEASKAEIKQDWRDRLDRQEQKSELQNRQEAQKEYRDWTEKAEFSKEARQERGGLRGNVSEGQMWANATERATQTRATASEEAVMREYLAEKMRSGQYEPLTMEQMREKLSEQVQRGGVLRYGERYTSPEFVKAERSYYSQLHARHTSFTLTKQAAHEKVQAWDNAERQQNHRGLSELQKEAAEKILTSKDFLTITQGAAGAGKTTTMRAVGDILRGEGFMVEGLSPTGVAAKNLEKETGIESRTIESYLRSERTERAVLILDEASMLDSRTAKELFEKAAADGSKIAPVGDQNQFESIGAGAVFSRMVEAREKEGKLIELNENFRQRDPGLREAVEYARRGEMAQAIGILEERGNIHEIENTRYRREEISERYDDKTLIITGTTAGREELNNRIHERLKEEGRLKDGREYSLARKEPDGTQTERKLEIAVGEKIIFLDNDRRGYDIMNGESATVLETKKNSLMVETEDKRKLEIDLERYNAIDYGYAMTAFKAEGQTFDRVIIEHDTRVPSLSDMRSQYVSITRAREDVQIYTDNKEDLKELAQVKSRSEDTLTEERPMDLPGRELVEAPARMREDIQSKSEAEPLEAWTEERQKRELANLQRLEKEETAKNWREAGAEREQYHEKAEEKEPELHTEQAGDTLDERIQRDNERLYREEQEDREQGRGKENDYELER